MRNQLEILTETIILTRTSIKEEIHQKQRINFKKLKCYNITKLNMKKNKKA